MPQIGHPVALWSMIEIEVYRRERRKKRSGVPSNSMWFLTCCQREGRRREKWPEKIDGYRRRKHMTSVSSV